MKKDIGEPEAIRGYAIRVRGHLSTGWEDWFGADVRLRQLDDGRTEALCLPCDQAALLGLLARLHDLGLPLLSVHQIAESQPENDAKARYTQTSQEDPMKTLSANSPLTTATLEAENQEKPAMKAMTYARYGGPEVLELKELDRPEPKDDEVLIRIHATTVGSADMAFREGGSLAIRLFFGLFKPSIPVLGTDLAGTVVGVGRDITRFEVGDEVFGATSAAFGTHAEFICVSEKECLLHKAEGLPFAEAAAMCSLTALPFLRDHGKIRPGHRVLINGASGTVGSDAVQVAKILGAHVTAVCSTRNVERVREIGADEVIDYTQGDFTRSAEAGSFDIVFDAVGKSSFSHCKALLKAEGTYLNPVLSAGVLFQMLWTSFRRKKVKFATTGLNKPEVRARDLQQMMEWYTQGKYEPVIGRRYPLEEMVEAHRHVDTGHKRGSVVIEVWPRAQAT